MAISVKQSSLQIMVTILLCMLFMLSCITFWYQSSIVTDQNIVNDVALLASIFKKINKQCHIVDFKFQQNNSIDYLQVIAFEGSEIGSMALKDPKKWQGPYLRDNLTAQGKFYQIVKTREGYFIAPGNGVTLHNGKTVGKEIRFDYNAHLSGMAQNPHLLQFQGKPLVAPLEIGLHKPPIPVDEVSAE